MKEIFIDDVREEFVREYVFPMFRCAEPERLRCWHNGMCAFRSFVSLHRNPSYCMRRDEPLVRGNHERHKM